MSAELLSMWTDLLRERTRLVDDAYSSLKSVRLEAVPDLGPSSSPARAVLQGLESDIPDCALVVNTIASSMIAAANSFEDLEEQIRSGMVSELTAFDA